MSLDQIAVVLIAIAVGVSGQLAYLFVVDHEMVRASRGRIKELQSEMKQVKPGEPRYKEIFNEMMAENSKVMKQTAMKPMFVTFVPFIIVFLMMSAYFSYVPIAIGAPIHTVVSGNFNGTVYSANNCISLNKTYNLSFSQSNLPQSFDSVLNSRTCTLFSTQGSKTYNVSLAGLLNDNHPKSYLLGHAKVAFYPKTLIIATLPFSLPFIGKDMTWFWAYFIVSLITSLVFGRILRHYKLIA